VSSAGKEFPPPSRCAISCALPDQPSVLQSALLKLDRGLAADPQNADRKSQPQHRQNPGPGIELVSIPASERAAMASSA